MNKEIELQALITEREGMLADNKDRENRGEALAWPGNMFVDLAKDIRALDNIEDSQNVNQQTKVTKCPWCNGEGQRPATTTHGMKNCVICNGTGKL